VACIKITFKGEDFILVGKDINYGGAIAKQEDYENCRPSYAHLMRDGRVMRYGEQIGTKEDVSFGEEAETNPTAAGLLEALHCGLDILEGKHPWGRGHSAK
jgi:hypothetical protein